MARPERTWVEEAAVSIRAAFARCTLACYPFQNGQGRIIDRTFLSRLSFPERTIRVRAADGFEMVVNPNDHVGRHLLLTGRFDHTVVRVLREFSRPGDRVWDIGANVGYVSCCMLALVPGSVVVAVEPQPELVELLTGNLAGFGAGRATVVAAAISGATGSATMQTNTANSGAGKLVERPSPGAGTLQVPTISGEDFARRYRTEPVNLVKIDVEGHERTVLESLAAALEADRPRAIVFECHDLMADPGSHPVHALLRGIGYEVSAVQKRLNSHRLVPLERMRGERVRSADFVATPRSRVVITAAAGLPAEVEAVRAGAGMGPGPLSER